VSRFVAGRRRKDPGDEASSADVGGSHPLSDVIAAILSAFVQAWGTMDSTSAELAKQYWADPVLRSLPLPAFAIPQVTVRLKVAVADVSSRGGGATQSDAVRIFVEFTELQRVPEHLISEVEFSLTPREIAGVEHAEEAMRD